MSGAHCTDKHADSIKGGSHKWHHTSSSRINILTLFHIFTKGANKSGMGTQGREVKMKAVKKKGQRGRDADLSDGDDNEPGPTSSKQQQVLPFLSVDELQTHLREADILSDAPEEMVVEIAEMLHR